MKTYDETISAVFSKGDELLEKRRERSAMIKHTSYAVSGLCAAAIVGVGIWRITDHGKMPESALSETETAEEPTTNISVTTADTNTVTSSASQTSRETSSASTTAKTTAQSNTTVKPATAESNEVSTVTVTSSQTSKTADVPAVTENSSQTSAPEETAIRITTTVTTTQPAGSEPPQEDVTTTSFESDIIRKLPTIFSTVALSESDSVDSRQRGQEFVYSYHNISEDETGALLKQLPLHGQYNNADVDSNAGLYEINGWSPDAVAGVKFEGRDDFFLYCNKTYSPENLGEFISAFGLDSDDIIRECYRGNAKAEDIAPEKAWAMLTADRSLPDVTDSCKGRYFAESERIWLTSVRASDQWLTVRIGIDPQGYIVTDTNTAIPDRYFYIGEERAREMIAELIDL